MEYDVRMVAYHSNYEENLDCFCEKNELYIAGDTHYLGDGMYFWDNVQDLEFWYKKKLKESSGKKILKIQARIEYNTNQIMDLTIKEEFEKLFKIYEIIENAHRKKTNKSSLALGDVINKLFNSRDSFIGTYMSTIKIMKFGLCYKDLDCGYISNKKDYYSNKLFDNQSIVFDVRTIYCAKPGVNILFKGIIDEEVAS